MDEIIKKNLLKIVERLREIAIRAEEVNLKVNLNIDPSDFGNLEVILTHTNYEAEIFEVSLCDDFESDFGNVLDAITEAVLEEESYC